MFINDPSILSPLFDIRETVVATTALNRVDACKSNYNRVMLMICKADIQPGWASTNESIAATDGYRFTTENPVMKLTFRDDGILVCQRWIVFAAAMGARYTVFETIYTPSRAS